jgi:tRNA U38,U39,U40 pseudouridine synthase TruA
MASFQRYVLKIQYRGTPFLGFTWQPGQEILSESAHGNTVSSSNTVPSSTTRSVEGFLRDALTAYCGNDSSRYANIQVSSRTDRGVHALGNTLHVDLLPTTKPPSSATKNSHKSMSYSILHGLNYHLSRIARRYNIKPHRFIRSFDRTNSGEVSTRDKKIIRNRRKQRDITAYDEKTSEEQRSLDDMGATPIFHPILPSDLRVIAVRPAPLFMYNAYVETHPFTQPYNVRWNARYSATERIYVYYVVYSTSSYSLFNDPQAQSPALVIDHGYASVFDSYMPFQADRAWRIHDTFDIPQDIHSDHRQKENISSALDIIAMKSAAQHLIGTHDFSSFRNEGCQRHSPTMTIREILIHTQSLRLSSLQLSTTPIQSNSLYHTPFMEPLLLSFPRSPNEDYAMYGSTCELVTISIRGNAFLYRQVRNMIGCLLDVGRRRYDAFAIPHLLSLKDRSMAPAAGPSHGLYLSNVSHGTFQI